MKTNKSIYWRSSFNAIVLQCLIFLPMVAGVSFGTSAYAASPDIGSQVPQEGLSLSPDAPPAASFTAVPTAGPAPLAVQFTDTSDPGSSPITWWTWSFGDFTDVGNTQNPSHVYAKPGAYLVALEVKNSFGSSWANTQTLITVSGPLTLGSVTPNAGSANGGTSVAIYGAGFWLTGNTRVTFDGVEAANVTGCSGGYGSLYVSCVTPAHGVGTVDVTVINPDGSSATLASGYTYGYPPTANFSGAPRSGPAPLTVVFVDESAPGSGPITQRYWDFGDGTSQGGEGEGEGEGQMPVSYDSLTLDAILNVEMNGEPVKESPGYEWIGTFFAFKTADGTYGKFIVEGMDAANDALTIGWQTYDYAGAGIVCEGHNLQIPVGYGCDFDSPDLAHILRTQDGTADITWQGDQLTVDAQNCVCTVVYRALADGAVMHTYAVPGLYSVTMQASNAFGSDKQWWTNYIEVSGPPTVTSISPNAGTVAGWTSVDIYGSGFYEAMRVQFGGVDPGNVQVYDNGHIGCRTPPHDPGPVDVTVIGPDGSQTVVPNGFTFGFVPDAFFTADPKEGSAPLTVQFTDASVSAGGPITSWQWNFGDGTSDTSQNPTHTYTMPGSFSVQMGVSNAFGSNWFYLEIPVSGTPTITSISPDKGDGTTYGRPWVKICGTGFWTDETTRVMFDGAQSQAVYVQRNSDGTTCVNAEAPTPHPAGIVDVTVINPDGASATLPNGFTYGFPPAANFTALNAVGPAPLTVTFLDCSNPGSDPITRWNWVFGDNSPDGSGPNPTHVYMTPGQYTVYLSVWNDFDSSNKNIQYFVSVLGPPTLTGVSPGYGPTNGTQSANINGTGFWTTGGAVRVLFGGVESATVSPSSNQITCLVPPHEAGTVDVTVINSDGSSATLANAYTYGDAPTVAFSGTPTSGIAPLTVQFTDESESSGEPITQRHWDFGDGYYLDTGEGEGEGEGEPTALPMDLGSWLFMNDAAGVFQSPAPGAYEQVDDGLKIYGTGVDAGSSLWYSGARLNGPAIYYLKWKANGAGAHSAFHTSLIGELLGDYRVYTSSGATDPCADDGFAVTDDEWYYTRIVVTWGDCTGITATGNYDDAGGAPVDSRGAAFTPTFYTVALSITDNDAGTPAYLVLGEAKTRVSTLDPHQVAHTYTAPGIYPVSLTESNAFGSGFHQEPRYITVTGTPKATSLQPDKGATTGGWTMIVGEGFYGAMRVFFGDIEARNVSLLDTFVLQCYAPPHDVGAVDVTVISPDGTKVVLANAYAYGLTPTASFTAGPALEGAAPLTVQFTDTSDPGTGGITIWSWNLGDSGDQAQNPVHTYTTPGQYWLQLTVYNAYGYSTSGSQLVTVNGPPMVNYMSPTSGYIAGDTYVSFTGTGFWSSGMRVTFGGVDATDVGMYSNGYGSTYLGCKTPAHAAGKVEVVVINPDGSGAKAPVSFEYFTGPTADFSASVRSGNLPLTVAFTDLSDPGSEPIKNWQWYFGDGSSDTVQNPVHTYTAPGSFLVELQVSNDFSSGYKTLYNYIVVAGLPAITNITPNMGDVNGGSLTIINGTGFGPTLTGWTQVSFGGIQAQNVYSYENGGTIICTTPPHGAGPVDVTVRNPDGASSTLRNGFTYGTGPKPAFSATPTQGRAPLTVTFADESDPGSGPITSWAWDVNGDGVTDFQDPVAGGVANALTAIERIYHVYTYETPGTYDVALTVTSPYGNETVTKQQYIRVAGADEFLLTLEPGVNGRIAALEQPPYKSGDVVHLVANPNFGYEVKAWGGSDDDAATSVTNTVTMTADKMVSATFGPAAQYMLSTSVVGGNGSLAPPSGPFFANSVVGLTATAYAGYRVKAWTGADIEPSVAPLNWVTMTSDKAVTVEFEQNSFAWLTTEASPYGAGYVTPAGRNVYPLGTNVTLTAAALPNFMFESWIGDIGGADPTASTITITMDFDKVVMAGFVPIPQYTLATSVVGGHGTISPPNGLYLANAVVTLVATADDGYTVMRWRGTDDDISMEATNTVHMTSDKTVTVAFMPAVPIPIASIEDLQKIGNDPAYPLDGNYVLAKDIDASATAGWNGGAGFAPIGSSRNPFPGMFDGQGHVLSGLVINLPGQYVGLFAFNGGTIRNLGITGGAVSGSYYVGGLAGASDGTVTNCYTMVAVTGFYLVGGLIGFNEDGEVTNCYATGVVSSTSSQEDGYIGGLMGQNDGTVTNCYATGAVTATLRYVGGLIGMNDYQGTVTDCYAAGAVSALSNVGGLVGFNSAGTATNCFATGAVSGGSLVGGLVGENEGAVANCFAIGAASGENYVGGLFGQNTVPVTNCYAPGAVKGTGSYTGGLIGDNNHNSAITACYWDMETSGLTSSAGGTGKTTAEMMTQATFVDWDFETIWTISEGQTYPWLQVFGPRYGLALAVNPPEAGAIKADPSGLFYIPGTVVSLVAAANDYYTFDRWSGDTAGIPDITANTAAINMDGNKRLTANFAVRRFTLTLTAAPSVGGVIQPDAGGTYDAGTLVTLMAMPVGNYVFERWTGDVAGIDVTASTIAVAMYQDRALTANFVPLCHLSLSASPINGGGVKPAGMIVYPAGTTVMITATPFPGYSFSRWTGNIVVPPSPTITITLTGDTNLTANFTMERLLYPLTTEVVGGHGTLSPPPGPQVAGSVVQLVATPDAGYQVKQWTGTDNDASIDTTNVVTVNRDQTVTVEFEPGVVSVVLNGTVTLEGRLAKPHAQWSIPLDVVVTPPAPSVPYEASVTTDDNGAFTLSNLTRGAYTFWLKGARALAASQSVTLIAGANNVDFGPLAEGDSNGDNKITLVDFSVLVTTFGKAAGQAGYNAQADFNGDGLVTLVDFSMLVRHFGQVGAAKPVVTKSVTQAKVLDKGLQPLVSETMAPGLAALIAVVPETVKTAVGESFEVMIEAQTDDLAIDGAAACLAFDPGVLQVENVVSTGRMPVPLANTYDNDAGRVVFAAGAFSNLPSGAVPLATVTFKCVANSEEVLLVLINADECETAVTAKGVALPSVTSDGVVVVDVK